MKQNAFIFCAFMALLGVLHCVLMEPASLVHPTEHSESHHETDSSDCVIHCSLHHLWMSDTTPELPLNLLTSDFIPAKIDFYHQVYSGSIFHPPLSL